MPRRNKEKKQKHEFQPRSHALIYLLAIMYLGWLLAQMLQSAFQGGADAPTTLELAGGVLVLGGGIVLLAILAWKMSHMPPKSAAAEEKPTETSEDPTESADAPEAEDSLTLNGGKDADR